LAGAGLLVFLAAPFLPLIETSATGSSTTSSCFGSSSDDSTILTGSGSISTDLTGSGSISTVSTGSGSISAVSTCSSSISAVSTGTGSISAVSTGSGSTSTVAIGSGAVSFFPLVAFLAGAGLLVFLAAPFLPLIETSATGSSTTSSCFGISSSDDLTILTGSGSISTDLTGSGSISTVSTGSGSISAVSTGSGSISAVSTGLGSISAVSTGSGSTSTVSIGSVAFLAGAGLVFLAAPLLPLVETSATGSSTTSSSSTSNCSTISFILDDPFFDFAVLTAGFSSSVVLSSASSSRENLGISILGLPLPPLLVLLGLAAPLPLTELLLLPLLEVVASLSTLGFLVLDAATASSTAFLLPFPALDVDGSCGVVSIVTAALATTMGCGVFRMSATPVKSSRTFFGPLCG